MRKVKRFRFAKWRAYTVSPSNRSLSHTSSEVTFHNQYWRTTSTDSVPLKVGSVQCCISRYRSTGTQRATVGGTTYSGSSKKSFWNSYAAISYRG
jgi:hypothetical protein